MMIRNTLIRASIRPWLIFLVLAAWMAACTPETPEPPPTPQPTPEVLTVHLASDLALLRPVISACAAEAGEIGVVVFEQPIPTLPESINSLTLQIGYPSGFSGRAYVLGKETYVIAAGAGAVRQTEELVRAIFSGEMPLNTASVWIPLDGTPARRLLDTWMNGERYTPDAFLSPGPAEMREALSGGEDVLGVLPSTWVQEELQTYSTIGSANVLALTKEKAAGKLREFLGCLQENTIFPAP